ncbi:MAG: STAS domain-containing protein [Acidimicrobiales bacterium]
MADDLEDDGMQTDGLTTATASADAALDLGQVELSEEEERRFSALVQWSYSDQSYAVEPHIDRECAKLVLRGEIDAMALAEVRALLDLIVDGRPIRLHIDLADAAFVSVSAMLCMVDAARHISEVVIERPSATVRRIFELVDADRRLTLG